MTSSNSSREQAGRFVGILDPGDRPDEMRGVLSKFRGNSPQLNVNSFVQNNAVKLRQRKLTCVKYVICGIFPAMDDCRWAQKSILPSFISFDHRFTCELKYDNNYNKCPIICHPNAQQAPSKSPQETPATTIGCAALRFGSD